MNNVNKKFAAKQPAIDSRDRFFVGPEVPFVGINKPLHTPLVGRIYPVVRYESSQGFTLIELVVTLAVAAILLVVAMPNLRTFIQNGRAHTQINNLVTDLTYARSEAVKRGINVGVCPSNDGKTCLSITSWQGGYLTFIDANLDGVLDGTETVVRYRQTLSGGDLLGLSLYPAGTTPTTVIFSGMGAPNIPTGSSELEFALSDPNRPSCPARHIWLNVVGQIYTSQKSVSTCP